MATANLCQCNKCNVILVDQNPQVNAPQFELRGDEEEMQYKEDKFGGYWVCPICDTDDYLQDEITLR